MIKWLTNELGTAQLSNVDKNIYKIVDVREMVDRQGNPDRLILKKINTGIKLIKENNKVIVCCDYGISRSNAIAIGILVKHYGYNFEDAVQYLMKKTGEKAIQLEVLDSIRKALRINYKKIKNKKTILITGASGFIGNALTNLLKEKYELITPSQSEVDILKGPIRLDLLVKKYGVGLIIHLANPKIYTTTRAMGEMIVMLKNVLDVCRANRIPVVFPSSWVVFGGYSNKKLISASENLIPQPKDTYGESKFLCEKLLNHYKETYSIETCLIRLSPIYGTGGNKPKFIWNFFEKAKKNLPIYTHKYKNGSPILDLLNIKDAARAIELIVEKKVYKTIHIGSGVGYSTFEIAQRIKKICQSESKISLQKINDYNTNIIMDISRAKKILNWSPKVDINDGLMDIFSKKYES